MIESMLFPGEFGLMSLVFVGFCRIDGVFSFDFVVIFDVDVAF